MVFILVGLKLKEKKKKENKSALKSPHLPHRFNSFFEEMKVTVACQVPRADHVAVELPELLHLQKEKPRAQELFSCLHGQKAVLLKKRNRGDTASAISFGGHTSFGVG